MFVALGVGALGTVVTSMITGYDAQWDISVAAFAQIILANSIGMLLGFAFGLLFRRLPRRDRRLLRGQPGAARPVRRARRGPGVVGRPRRVVRPERDPLPGSSTAPCTARTGSRLAITALLWIGLPLLVGLRLVLRSEVK
ncbi:hypothetical protein [Nocardioides convexus]|uniref:hypothetical protein n=1 Tax=Nocardioides convexus TaxID=2712224 RepID=UPI00241895D5|nr:hypothetical protein [Nocardioides convexus]